MSLRVLGLMTLIPLTLLTVAEAKSTPEPIVWFDEQGNCEFKPAAGFSSQTGLSSAIAKPRDVLIQEAKEQAQQNIKAQYCAGLSESQCAAIERRTGIIGYAEHPTKKHFCAVARVPVSIASDPTGRIAQERTLESDINNVLIKAIGLSNQLYFKSPVRSDTRCMAGLTGGELRSQMIKQATAKGATVLKTGQDTLTIETKVIPSTKSTKDWLVEVTADSFTHKSQVLGSFKLPAAMVDEQSQESPCIGSTSDERLTQGYAPHPSGLTVEIEVGDQRTTWCEGDKTSLTVKASEAAHIKVFSITEIPEQVSMMFYPHNTYKGTAKKTEARVSHELGDTEFFPISSQPKKESLLVVAVPKGGDFGSLNDWNNPCIETRPIEQWLPENVALNVYTYTIYPVGAESGHLHCDVNAVTLDAREDSTQGWKEYIGGLDTCGK